MLHATSTRWLVLVVGSTALTAASQDVPPAADPPQSQPAQSQPADRQPIITTVIEVRGDAQHKLMGAPEWTPCKIDDSYPERTMIRTGVRSSIKLQIGSEQPYTAMVIESVGLTILSEAYQTRDTKRVRIGVGYGRVRAGVAEGGLQSDFTVDSPVATLSKRGTWNFGMYFERGTQRFEVFLLDRGLVDAISKIRGRTITILPGEVVTQTMRHWLDEAQLRRNIPITDLLGQGQVEVAFNRMRQEGLGVINPGSGNQPLINLSSRFAQTQFRQSVLQNMSLPNLTPPPGQTPPVFRPEGFFGTGRGDQLIPILIDPNSALVRRGFAKPGKYNFRRSVLESWLKNQNRRR